MDTQDQSLSRALLDFIAPLVHTIDPKKTIDIERTLATLEAAKLVTALKEFVLSAVGNSSSSSTSEMGMKVDLNDEGRVENTSDSTASASGGGEVSLVPRTPQGSGEN
ncbi:hypothetical protein BDN70DRAFT_47817 [Pholiota conissans]|uniref:Uncharacterized protein n=1 Tax=Pholiota conissans TaxID=109636 RepID=A0A9P5YYZ1_9AGAR|nr:hypothetical protein BDN70DRAFT_47817 [Pholiota conissans]